jgi:hypothetical protein
MVRIVASSYVHGKEPIDLSLRVEPHWSGITLLDWTDELKVALDSSND